MSAPEPDVSSEGARLRVLRAIEFFTIHLAAGDDMSATVVALSKIGFDPGDPGDLAMAACARLAAVLLAFQAQHARVDHGCGLTPGVVLAEYATKTAGVRS